MNDDSKFLVQCVVRDCGMTASGCAAPSFNKVARMAFLQDVLEDPDDQELKERWMDEWSTYAPKRVPDAWKILPSRKRLVWVEVDDWNPTKEQKILEILEFDDWLRCVLWDCTLVVLKARPWPALIVADSSDSRPIIRNLPYSWERGLYEARSVRGRTMFGG